MPRWLSHVASPVLFVALSAAAAAGAAPSQKPARAALLPVVANGVTGDALARLRHLEDAVQRGAHDVAGIVVEDEARTRAGLASVDELGIRCEPGDTECLGKIAVLLEADRVISPIIRLERDKTTVRILVVGPHGEHAEAAGDAAVDPTSAEISALIADAVSLPLSGGTAPPPAPTPPPAPEPPPAPATTTSTTPTTSTAPAATPPPERAPSGQMLTGAAVAGGGALLVAVGGAGAVWANLALSDPQDYAKVRVPEMITGQIALGVAALGVAGVVGGCVLVGTAD